MQFVSLEIEFSNQQSQHRIRANRLIDAARTILADCGIQRGSLSIAVVDDPTIREVNRRHLEHDEATDTISFLFEHDGAYLEGEVLVSADTAARMAPTFGWSADDELLLYVIHATLHLVGFDDQSDTDRAAMRAEETRYLQHFGLTRSEESSPVDADSEGRSSSVPRPTGQGDDQA